MRVYSLAALLLTACPSPAPDAAQAPAPSATPAPAARPAADGALAGTVAETMDAAGYTYIQLDTASGPRWAAVSESPVKVGDSVTITNFTWMQGFHSKTLDRTFDQIAFGKLAAAGATPSGPGSAPVVDFREVLTPKPASPHGTPDPATVDAEIAKVAAPNGHTVAEVFAGKTELVGKTVAIRGKVVKFTPAVMNTNWLHLQDGSGSAGSGDNDVTVTTDDTAAIGDVVVVEGTLATDRDLGAGYTYDVLIDKATISR